MLGQDSGGPAVPVVPAPREVRLEAPIVVPAACVRLVDGPLVGL